MNTTSNELYILDLRMGSAFKRMFLQGPAGEIGSRTFDQLRSQISTFAVAAGSIEELTKKAHQLLEPAGFFQIAK